MSMLDPYVPRCQRGVVFFSSIPRDMRPPEVRNYFNEFGTILRMKFVPYPKKERRPGGPLLPLQYREGWMEFAKAADAEQAAARMNGSPVQCKRQRKCFGQLWTVKYMSDFSWDGLVEEQEGHRRARRAAEVEARRYERDTNEAYRRLVMEAAGKKRTTRRLRPTEEGTAESTAEGAAMPAAKKVRKEKDSAEEAHPHTVAKVSVKGNSVKMKTTASGAAKKGSRRKASV